VSDEESFTRLIYWGTTQLGFSLDETWLLPFGLLLDLMTCHRQFLGMEKPKREVGLDEIF
jgi:hypothetical protein